MQIGSLIGEGATSQVFACSVDGRALAMKWMRADFVGSQAGETIAAQFRREAAALARVQHPALPELVYTGEREGRPFLVMERLRGGSLADRLTEGPLPADELAELAASLLGALAALHRRGLVHRDITPQNIAYRASGGPVLMDLGLVCGVERATRRTDVVVGTLRYCAPEQIGVLHRPVDPRSDLYGLGATLYEAASGRAPFDYATATELLAAHAAEVPAPLAVDPVLAGTIAHLLRKDPDDRPESAQAVLQTLQPWQAVPSRVEWVGQRSVWAALRQLRTDAMGGRGAAVRVQGPPGAGESALTHAFATEAQSPEVGAQVLRIDGAATDAAAPTAWAEPALASAGDAETWVVLVTNAHQMSAGTQAGVLALAQRISRGRLGRFDVRLLLVLSGRELPPDDVVAVAIPECLTMEALDLEGSVAVLQTYLGPRSLPPDLGPSLHRLCLGNPGALVAFADLLIERGGLQVGPAAWAFDDGAIEQSTLPDGILGLLRQRLLDLPEAHRTTLAPIALCRGRMTEERLARIGGDVQAAVMAGQAAGVVRLTPDGRLRLAHPDLHEAFEPSLATREVHQAIADTLDLDEAEALAHHLEHGHLERHQAHHLQSARRAGSEALAGHRWPKALHHFRAALTSARALHRPVEERARLHKACGEAAIRLGLLHEAIEHLQRAREGLRGDEVEAEVEIMMADCFARQGADERAWPLLRSALAALGTDLPQTHDDLDQLASHAWAQVQERMAAAGHADRQSPARALVSRAYELAGFLAHFVDSPALMPAVTSLEWLNAHAQGPGRALARASVMVAFQRALQGDRDSVHAFADLSLAMADEAGDTETRGFCKTMYGVALDWVGDPQGRQRNLAFHDDIIAHCTAWDMAKHLGHIITMAFLRGESREVLNRTERLFQLSVLEGGSVRGLVSAYGSVALGHQAMGRVDEARRALAKQLEYAEQLGDSKPVWRYFWSARLAFAVGAGELGDPFDTALAKLDALGPTEWHNEYHTIAVAEGWMGRLRAATTPSERARASQALSLATQRIGARWVTIDLWRCHCEVYRSALAAHAGESLEALQRVDSAEQIAQACGSVWGVWAARRQRAHVFRDSAQPVAAARERCAADSIAQDAGWLGRLRQLTVEFGPAPQSGQGTSSSAVSSGRALEVDRFADALYRVTAAASASQDPVAQAESALDALVQVLGADRGFVFLFEDEELYMAAGRDRAGASVPDPRGHSTTVVGQVFQTQRAVVVTGTEAGELLGSKSAVAHDLRSIIASPLSAGDRHLGVVYLDSRVARGLFDSADVRTLHAVGRHVALAFEGAQNATLERQRSEQNRDLALTAAVHAFFLPESRTFACGNVSLRASYRPAARCGGDWWWVRETGDGVEFLVADVTGHGVAPAMVVAALASVVSVLDGAGLGLADLLHAMHKELRPMIVDRYCVSLMAVRLDDSGRGTLLGCGGPPALIARSEGQVHVVQAPGAPLLSGDLPRIGQTDFDLTSGDRLLVFSDGITETTSAAGRELGLKGLVRFLGRLGSSPLEQAASQLEQAVDLFRGPGPADDDQSFCLVEWRPTL